MASNSSDGTTKASANHKVNPRVTSRIEDIDLSKLESDGTNQQPDLPDPSPLPASRELARLMGRTFLTHLTREFNNGRHVDALGYLPKCVGKPPSGYTIYFVNRGSGTGIRVMIFGHPKGPTDSLAHFVEHVVSIIQCNLANCACPLCVGSCRQFDLDTVAVVPAPT
ncbi:hypothetical protein D6C87_08460 [Aureobasidium pullulans]|uniref:Cryptic loci regulator 2 N-terminal domain-containing protein n=1 Tax=Aureobasidium pullulans TaxID=5580 RepID=A0AB38LT61_AURPU|nr:hypothetical protein D6C94_06512 [Aureobasidium pullulans]THZ37491.1 hypothetical protein D6C87_08460 [Aureobasidium pullulans]